MQKEPVKLLLESVPHVVGENALAFSSGFFSGYSKVFVLVDENTKKYCWPVFRQHLSAVAIDGLIHIRSGEEYKNIETAVFIWQELTRLGADRHALLINLGGGVITDIGGFTAATFKRGIDFVNIPTTLLGQVDAAIGSKTGIDFQNLKNHVGLFADPKAVVIDPVFLKTLPEKQRRSGFAEMIKYALIMDFPLWEMMKEKSFDKLQEELSAMMIMAVKDKIAVVEKDKHESGLRKLLNFGHTAGHALETFLMESADPATHGEAVAAGMICATRISTQLSVCDGSYAQAIYRTIDLTFPRLSFSEKDIPALLRLMRQDKKNVGGTLRFTLLQKPGQAIPDRPVTENAVEESLRFYLRNQ